jgi:hypothetical protein
MGAGNGWEGTAAGRGPKGLFAAGNQFSRGNTGGCQRAVRWQREIRECASQQDRRAVIQAMVDAAKGGDVAAAKLLWPYWYGRPPVTIDLDLNLIDERPRVIILPDNHTGRDSRLPPPGANPPDEGG